MTSTLSPDEERVIMRGLAVQPFLTGLLGYLLFSATDAAIALAVFFAITGTVITGCVAYPLARRFIRRRQLTFRRTLASGAVLGNIPAAIAAVLVIAGSTDTAADLGTLMRPAAIGTLVGVVSAAAFWGLSGRRLKHDGTSG